MASEQDGRDVWHAVELWIGGFSCCSSKCSTRSYKPPRFWSYTFVICSVKKTSCVCLPPPPRGNVSENFSFQQMCHSGEISLMVYFTDQSDSRRTPPFPVVCQAAPYLPTSLPPTLANTHPVTPLPPSPKCKWLSCISEQHAMAPERQSFGFQ